MIYNIFEIFLMLRLRLISQKSLGGFRRMKSLTYNFRAYRGISLKEALDVVTEQRYFQKEKTQFDSDCGANAVFGDGAYFTEEFTLAAEYAQCHASREQDYAAVLVQTLIFSCPLFLNEEYTEKQLRTDVLKWRIGEEKVRKLFQGEEILYIHLADSIRSYAISRGYDSIVTNLPDGSKYFVGYNPETQIKNIRLDFSFTQEEALASTFRELRNAYKKFKSKSSALL